MFIGHFAPGIALAARKDAPALALMCVGGQLLDIAFFPLVLVGIEKMRIIPGFTKMMPLDLYHMPYSHSLLGAVIFAGLFGWLISSFSHSSVKRRTGIIAALAVLSHWFLDVLVHAPDMTLFGSDKPFGLALWNYPAIEMPVELALVVVAVFVYVRHTRALTPAGKYAPWLFLLMLLVLQAINWFGPPPEAVVPGALLALVAFTVVCSAAFFVQRTRRHI
jgi:membrane-bound metal-dependent hydrolase YbcI (DUF457 family)